MPDKIVFHLRLTGPECQRKAALNGNGNYFKKCNRRMKNIVAARQSGVPRHSINICGL